MEKVNEKKQYLLANYFGDNHYMILLLDKLKC